MFKILFISFAIVVSLVSCGKSGGGDSSAQPNDKYDASAAKQGAADCLNKLELPLTNEIFGNDIVDGQKGQYNLIELAQFGSGLSEKGKLMYLAARTRLSAVAANVPAISPIQELQCSNIEMFPDGRIALNAEGRLAFQRLDGKGLQSNARLFRHKFTLFGPEVGNNPMMEYSTLVDTNRDHSIIERRLSDTGKIQFFRVDQDKIALRLEVSDSNGMRVITLFIYQLVE